MTTTRPGRSAGGSSVLTGWRRSLLGIERSVIVSMRNDGELSEDVLREMQHDLDLEEALLERRSDAVDGHLDELPGGSSPATVRGQRTGQRCCEEPAG